ncbi:peptidylprolyl isomerase [Polaribacter aquimarinus]|uniref:Periplasmic chaperone PpiD n=1 Tax=Polaribacter aquimarinus TaxID=2100726 RepID=A0A2U2J727_9FLAO|nr:peptidylprolyl isomerase [Polaribacter aquimarinus]PWG04138.1 peptidylprolyl isomerase [Polaribacter aquimarinus]
MAVLSKIRERSMFLIIIIGLALFAFVLDPSTLGDFFNSNKVNEIGEVNGESISRQEFADELESYKQQRGGRVSEMQAVKAVWNNILRQKIYKNQLEEAGISVGEADVWKELINVPSVKNNPQYLNEAGLFDESKFKQFLADTKENNPQLWSAWSNYMNQIKTNTERNAYDNLINAGLGASLKEGEADYFINNTKLNTQFIFIPYSSIVDSLVNVTKSDIANYIKENEADFKVDESRDISYVKFDITATPEDEAAIKDEVSKLLEDSIDRNKQTVVGLKNATNYKEFLNENDSDINLDENFKFKKDISNVISEKVFAGSKGDVFGPYKDKGFFKISKITEISKMPDSVKASHILIPFVGSQAANNETTKTEAQAKKTVDSIFNLVKRNKAKYTEIANEVNPDGTKGKGGDIGWVNYTAAFSPNFDADFANYMFNNKKGDINVVKTKFGFHIIRIDDQKNAQKVVKLVTFGRKIVASEATENAVFQKAEQFALELSKERRFTEVSKENKYLIRPAVGLKVLDENVPGLGNQRQIVSWAFGANTKVGTFKRFDLEGSHIVAIVSSKVDKGLSPVNKASARVKPILKNRKKAEIIRAKLNGNTLQEIANSNNTAIKTGTNVTLKSPTLSGAGSEPKIVGAMYNAELNKVYKGIEGNRGVYAFVVTKKELPTALPNYEASRKRIAQSRKGLNYRIFESIKKATEVKDYRANMYVSN